MGHHPPNINFYFRHCPSDFADFPVSETAKWCFRLTLYMLPNRKFFFKVFYIFSTDFVPCFSSPAFFPFFFSLIWNARMFIYLY